MEQQAVFLAVVAFGVLLFFIAWGVPIGVTLCLAGMLGMFLFRGSLDSAFHIVTYVLRDMATSYAFIVIPLFILMGALAGATGVAGDFFSAANKLIGRIRGGLGMAVCYACAALGAVTGSTISATMVMTKIALPELKRFNYQPAFALGIIASAATVAIMIPPSIMLVVYGILADQSIGRLLVGGTIPGIIKAIIYSLFIWGRAQLQPNIAPPGVKYPWKEALLSLKDVIPLVGVMLAIIFGILFGLWTPVEAGAVGVVVIFFLGLIRRRLSRAGITEGGIETALTCGAIFILIVGSLTFSRFLAVTGVTEMIITYFVALHLSPIVFLLILLGFFTILGCFVEGIAMEALTIPILLPIIIEMGWDPIWFGIILTKLVQIAALTPPVGLNLYAMKSVAPEEDFLTIAWGCLPFWILELGIIMLFFFVPQLVLWLPSLML